MNEPTLLKRHQTDISLKNWREQEKLALELLQVVGALRFDKAIELTIFRRAIYDTRASTLINNHSYAKRYSSKEITIAYPRRKCDFIMYRLIISEIYI